MNIIITPSVEIVAQTQFIGSRVFEIPDDGDDHVKLGSFAAKVCYDSRGKDGRANILNQEAILKHRHGSVMEHASVSLYISGISRACSLEINRHRPISISQRSTRYAAEEDAAIVLDPYYADIYTQYNFSESFVPTIMPKVTEDYRRMGLLRYYVEMCRNAIVEYDRQVEYLMLLNPDGLEGFALRKWARGKARNVLPHSLETRAVYTTNHRAWRWFIESRSNRHAEPEIRRLAQYVLEALSSVAPTYYEDFEVTGVVDNINEYTPKYSKV